MTNIKVGIVEDDMIVSEVLSEILMQLGYTPTKPAHSYSEALIMLEKEKPDIVLVDIKLSGAKDGIDVAWKIRDLYNIPFIFLSAHSDINTVERAKELYPPAYLVKPFNKEDLYTSIEICLHNFSMIPGNSKPTENSNYIIKESLFIKQGNSFHKVRLEDITYLESDNVHIFVNTLTNRLLVRSTIKHYISLLGSDNFSRVHRSFVINTNHIVSINADSIFVGSHEIPLGKAYREKLLTRLRLG